MATGDPEYSNFSLLPDEGDALHPSRFINNLVLVAGVAQDIDLTAITDVGGRQPKRVYMNGDCSYWVAYRVAGDVTPPTASVPVATITNGAGVEYMPSGRALHALSGLSIISPEGGNLSLSFYWS